LVVVWDTKTWQQTSWSGHQNEYTVYDSKGDLVKWGSTQNDECGERNLWNSDRPDTNAQSPSENASQTVTGCPAICDITLES
jgi:hypothetical protein